MKDEGRAAIILGNHNLDPSGHIRQTDQPFMNYLYSHYNVLQNIEINGMFIKSRGQPGRFDLYSYQGESPTGHERHRSAG